MAKYRVQRSDGVQTIDEKKLRKKLRSNDLSGLELVRREDDQSWTPLCETELFREEVPFRGHPMRAARHRQVKDFLSHLTGWTITAGVMASLGQWFPFWLLIWGFFVVAHGAKVAPAALGLLGEHRLLQAPQAAASLPEPDQAERKAIAPPANASSPLSDEVAQIRTLLDKRGGPQADSLAREVEQLVKTLQEIARRRADLEAQLTPTELQELEAAREQTRLRLESAKTDQDRDLSRQELEAIEQRYEAVEHAKRTLERLQSRERVAGHQLKQLRLDLTQAEAHVVDVPDFAGRVEAIRIEADALEEVEEVLAQAKRP